jgi:predicted nucleotide-binding protein
MTLRQNIDDFKQQSKNKSFLNIVGALLKKLGAMLNIYKQWKLYSQEMKELELKSKQYTSELEFLRAQSIAQKPEKPKNNKVFIAHGGKKDSYKLKTCVDFLKNELQLEPIVPKYSKNRFNYSTISTFNELREDCSAAIILSTLDIENQSAEENELSDTLYVEDQLLSNNALFECGYFIGKFHKEKQCRVIILKSYFIKIPDELYGINYLSFHKSIRETFYQLKNEFERWGFID